MVEVDGSILFPKPVWPKKAVPYVPRDPIKESLKVGGATGLIFYGMHLRRQLQYRKGSARPGILKYLSMFDMSSNKNKHQILSIPLAAAAYTFLSAAGYNLNEEDRPGVQFSATFIAITLAAALKPNFPIARSFGLAAGLGTAAALFTWTQGFSLGENSFHQTMVDGRIKESSEEGKQGFWETVHRRPFSRTVLELGEGRGIAKP